MYHYNDTMKKIRARYWYILVYKVCWCVLIIRTLVSPHSKNVLVIIRTSDNEITYFWFGAVVTNSLGFPSDSKDSWEKNFKTSIHLRM